MRKGYFYESIFTNFTYMGITRRCELCAIGGMGRPFFHIYINNRIRGNLSYDPDKEIWMAHSARGSSRDIGAQLGEVVEDYMLNNGVRFY